MEQIWITSANNLFQTESLLLHPNSPQIWPETNISLRSDLPGPISSVGEIARLQRLSDNDSELLLPSAMLTTLCEDNRRLTSFMRAAHSLCEEAGDLATASLLENWIDEIERRSWFLSATLG